MCSNWVKPRTGEAQCAGCNCPFDGWAITLSGKRIDIADVGEHLDQLSPPRPAQLLVHWHNKCALRQAGEHSFLPVINRKRVHSFLPVINRKREHSFPPVINKKKRTLLSACNQQKKRGSSTWEYTASHHPYIMSWPFWAGLSAQPCNFLWRCTCSAETKVA